MGTSMRNNNSIFSGIHRAFSTLFYTLWQGIKYLWRNKGYTLASIATISSCLFLFGIFFSVVLNFEHMVKSAEKDVSVTVFFKDGVTEDQINQLKIAVEERPEVSKVKYVSADEAWKEFSKDYLGDYADGFTENPLEGSENLEIYLNDVSKQADLVSYLEGIDGVREVNRSELTANTLSGANSLIGYISMAIIAILFVVSLFLISNTVASGIISHKDEITIMKYIGATDFFVQAPYVFEGIIIGFIGSIIPLVLIWYLYHKVIALVNGKFAILSSLLSFLPLKVVFHDLVPISVALGVGIGFLGSMFTIRKHLHV